MVGLMKVWLAANFISCIIAKVTEVTPKDKANVYDARNIWNTLEKLKAQVNELSDQISKLNNCGQDLRLNLEESRNALFLPSERFEGRRYWLTKSVLPLSVDIAEVICEIHGGYLAEVDTDEEFSFIREYLVIRKVFNAVIVGATDEETDGVWVNRHSKTIMNSTKWGPHEPNGGKSENCLCYFPYSSVLFLNDCMCHVTNSFYAAGYLCEIPE